jgi:hypothetical protein
MQLARPLLAVLLCSVLPANAQQAHYQKHGAALLPDDAVSPGVVAITGTQKVCSTKWGTDARFVTPALKKQVYAAYGLAPGKGTKDMPTP